MHGNSVAMHFPVILREFVNSALTHPLTHPPTPSSTHTLSVSFICLLWLVWLVIHPPTYPPIHSFIRSFFESVGHAQKDHESLNRSTSDVCPEASPPA